MTLEINLSAMKSSPFDYESVLHTTTEDDSQHSLGIANQQDDDCEFEKESCIMTDMTDPTCNENGKQESRGKQNQNKTKLTFTCDICNKVFHKRSRLESHSIVHSDDRFFICSVCGKGFKNSTQLSRHNNTHSTVPNFCCNICGRGFKHNDVAKHVKRFHTGAQKSIRGGVAHSQANLSNTKSQKRMQSSDESAKECVFRPVLTHVVNQTHQSPKQRSHHSVIIQNRPPEQKMGRLHEVSQHHSPDSGIHLTDSLSGNSNDSVPIPPSTIKSYHCTFCSMTFGSPNALASHMLSHPKSVEVQEKVLRRGRKTHVCPHCNKTFTRSAGLRAHLDLHSGIEKKREPNPDFQCSICGKFFVRRAGLNAHVLLHEGVPRFWCDEEACGRAFVHSYQLTRHKRLHSDVCPYTCDVCGKSFRYNDLSKHMRIHTGHKPYSCQHCGKSFTFNSSLRAHERMHLALKDHICQICNVGFNTSSGLKRHAKTHVRESENEKNEHCPSCGEKFPSEMELSLHLQESQPCSQLQQKNHQSTDLQSLQHLHDVQQVNIQQTQHIQVFPVSQVQQVDPLSELPMHGMHVGILQDMPVHAPHESDVLSIDHPSNLVTLAASNPGPLISEKASQSGPGITETALLPFPVSVPFGINSSDQMQLNPFLCWEQKY